MKIRKRHWSIIVSTLPILLGAWLGYATGFFMWSNQKNYELKYADMKQKEMLYSEVIDIYQVIHNDLIPNFDEKVKNKTSIEITNKYGNVMNRCILYFDEPIVKMIEETMLPGYWENTNETEMNKIMQAIVKEIKKDRKALEL